MFKGVAGPEPPRIDVAAIDVLRRRSPGERTLAYLDQSTLSSLARREPDFNALRELLESTVAAGRLLCAYSPEHRDESMLAGRELCETIDALGDELSTGIDLRHRTDIEWREIHAAADAFFGRGISPFWSEAFRTDPQTPRDDLFVEFLGSQLRVRVRSAPVAWEQDEVRHEKGKEDPMVGIYESLRAGGYSFETIAEDNLVAMLKWKLGPLFDPARFAQLAQQRAAAVMREWERSDTTSLAAGSAWSRYTASAHLLAQTKALVDRHPALAQRSDEFMTSAELRAAPTLRYPALLRAALATEPNGRRARPTDGYDIEHLTIGLSRCDIVTADRSMTRIVRDRGLIPMGCQLFEYSDVAGLAEAIAAATGQTL